MDVVLNRGDVISTFAYIQIQLCSNTLALLHKLSVCSSRDTSGEAQDGGDSAEQPLVHERVEKRLHNVQRALF